MTLRLLLLPALPLLAAALLPFCGRWSARNLALAAGATAAAVLAVVLSLAGSVVGGQNPAALVPWAPSAGLDLSFFADGLSLLFLLMISGIGLLIVIYARGYMGDDEPGLARFYASLLLFMAAMLGVVTSANLLLLVVFWELTSISSFLLIGFRDEQAPSRSGAYQALIVTGLGGLSLLAGVLVLGRAAGTYEIPALLQRGAAVAELPGAGAALALILFGAFTKSAQVPFHFWLPSAMAAPTPVSAYLHSATMVKAGIFLVARLSPLFAATDLWFYALSGFGAATMIVGGLGALRQTDLKALLAYSTISQLGLIMTLYGYGTDLAAAAATLHILNHAMFKAPLFMAAGIVDHEAETRDVRRLGGLVSSMPRTTLVLCIGSAAMTGMPLFNGFISKELFYEASLAQASRGLWGTTLPWLATGASVLTVIYTLRLTLGACFGSSRCDRHPHEAPAGLRLPAELLAAGCVVVGMVPALAEPLIGSAVSAVTGRPADLHLAIWHGWTLSLGMSMFATAAGLGFYVVRHDPVADPPAPRLGRTAGEIYDLGVKKLLAGARALTDRWQTGRLRYYLRVVLGFTLLLTVSGLFAGSPAANLRPLTAPVAGALPLAFVTVLGALAVAAFSRRRLPSVISLGAVGLLVAVYFVWLSAPDLVVTQLLVETVSTILIVLVLYFLPKKTPGREPRPRLALDAAIATAVGAGVAAAVYAVMSRPFESISSYHLAESVPGGGGRNAVNVILVDFRGYDTLGEITVLAIAAIGILALVQAGRRDA